LDQFVGFENGFFLFEALYDRGGIVYISSLIFLFVWDGLAMANHWIGGMSERIWQRVFGGEVAGGDFPPAAEG
jgi:hypothetical protein